MGPGGMMEIGRDEIDRIVRTQVMTALAVALLLLAGCGWQPLYARPTPDPSSGGVTAAMAFVSIDPVSTNNTLDPLTGGSKLPYDSRAAQMLHNDLRDALNPYGQPSETTYHLAIELTESLTRTASLGNGDATRDDLALVAKYKLLNEKGQAVLQDRARIVTSYDVLNQPFSDLQSHNDALQRGTDQLAQMIQTRLAVFLKQ
jgi:LPS-assembly lipoprotein